MVDSLSTALKNAKHDTVKLKLLVELSESCEPDQISKYAEPAIVLADKLLQDDSYENIRSRIFYEKGGAYNNLGFMYESQGNPLKAKDNYQQSLLAKEKAGDQHGVAMAYMSMGAVYKNRGEINNAFDYFNRSLKVSEKINDKYIAALNLNNIGGIYLYQGHLKQASENFTRALKLNKEANNKQGIAISLNNLGVICVTTKDLPNAINYYRQSLQIQQEIGHKTGIGRLLFNIGRVYNDYGDFEAALNYYAQSVKMYKELKEKPILAAVYHQICRTYINKAKNEKEAAQQKNYRLALLYNDTSFVISKELGYPDDIRNAEESYAAVYSNTGKYELAFEHYKKYIALRDSTNNTETRKASVKNQLKYEFEKKEAVIKEQQEKERALAEEKNRFQKIVIASVVIGLLFVIVFAAFILRNLRVTRLQKETIEQKQKEIVESIQYAKRIQTALMPSENYVDTNLKRLKGK